jgi:tRNA(adenine34) deaminase
MHSHQSDDRSLHPTIVHDDLYWMNVALEEAKRAQEQDEVPIGACLVNQHGLVSTGRNLRETNQDPAGHAELLAIREAAKALGRWRLSDCTLYVTLEPCTMCAGAIILARIPRVVYAVRDPKAGAGGSLFNILQDARLNHRTEITEGVLAAEASELLKKFFREKRKKQKEKA